MRIFLQIIIQEKGLDDYRSFCIAQDGEERWELRGYGKTPGEAADNAFERFKSEDWESFGCLIHADELDVLRKRDLEVREAIGSCIDDYITGKLKTLSNFCDRLAKFTVRPQRKID